MSVNNRASIKTDISKLEIETNIAHKIVGIQAENIKNINTIEMKISSNKSSQHYSYDQKHTDQLKWLILKTTENIHMHHNSPKINHQWTQKATIYFNFRNGGMPSDGIFSNIYLQTTSE